MKPEQFIREYGVEKAREVVEGAPARVNWYQVKGRYSNDLYSCNHELYGEAIMLSDLKRLVESLDRVKHRGGLSKTKDHLDYLISFGSEFAGVSKDEIKELRQACRDHESIYGGGDE